MIVVAVQSGHLSLPNYERTSRQKVAAGGEKIAA